MQTSSTTKYLGKCVSNSWIRPELACIAHIDNHLYATDSFKLARIEVEEKTPENQTVYYDGKLVSKLPQQFDMNSAKKEVDSVYPDAKQLIKNKLDDANVLGVFQVQYLIDLLNVVKTKSSTVTLLRRDADYEPLMLEADKVLGVLMPMNRTR
jgi:hypothetical protein